MQVEFLAKFSNDIDQIGQKTVRSNIKKIIKLFESADNLNNIPNLKKLVGHMNAFRIRIGDYRIGFFFEK